MYKYLFRFLYIFCFYFTITLVNAIIYISTVVQKNPIERGEFPMVRRFFGISLMLLSAIAGIISLFRLILKPLHDLLWVLGSKFPFGNFFLGIGIILLSSLFFGIGLGLTLKDTHKP